MQHCINPFSKTRELLFQPVATYLIKLFFLSHHPLLRPSLVYHCGPYNSYTSPTKDRSHPKTTPPQLDRLSYVYTCPMRCVKDHKGSAIISFVDPSRWKNLLRPINASIWVIPSRCHKSWSLIDKEKYFSFNNRSINFLEPWSINYLLLDLSAKRPVMDPLHMIEFNIFHLLNSFGASWLILKCSWHFSFLRGYHSIICGSKEYGPPQIIPSTFDTHLLLLDLLLLPNWIERYRDACATGISLYYRIFIPLSDCCRTCRY